MPYPGGVHLDKIADNGNPDLFKLPYPKIDGCPYDFSFSGLKTAVINAIHNAEQKGEKVNSADVAASLRQRVCDMLISSTLKAADDLGYKTVVMSGGVSANSELRRRMSDECEKRGIKLYYPELKYCGDNAAMVGVQAYYEHISGNIAGADLNAFATMAIDVLNY